MGKVLMVATVDDHLNAFHLPYIARLSQIGHTVDAACRVMGQVPPLPNVRRQWDIGFQRQPFHHKNIVAYHQLEQIIDTEQYDLLHCHTPVGSAVSRLAARSARKRGMKVMYTAHGFHFYKGAPLLNWLMYYPAERLLARQTDALITINQEDYERAKHFKAGRVYHVDGMGVDVQKFASHQGNREGTRQNMGVPLDACLLLSVGELNRNKNHQIIIRALAQLKDPSVHLAIAGRGPLLDEYVQLADELGVVKNVHFLGYRDDTPELYKAADIFCFPSQREGLPISVIEAAASGLPVVGSAIRGVKDIVTDGVNGILVNQNDLADVARGLGTVIRDQALREQMGQVGQAAASRFDLGMSVSEMERIYGGLLNHERPNWW